MDSLYFYLMLRSKNLRIVLVIIWCVAAAAIVWSLVSRHRADADRSEIDLLPSDVARRTTDFEFSRRKSGREVFRVQATRSVVTRQDVHSLEEVWLTRFDETGRPTDSVEGKAAVYDAAAGSIEFERNVVVHLSDGTDLFADQVRADLESERVLVEESFRFLSGTLQGSGRQLTYWIPDKRMTIGEDFELIFPSSSGPSRAGSQRAVYELDRGLVEMNGRARAVGPNQELMGDRIEAALDSQRRLKSARASGNANLQIGGASSREFQGAVIELSFSHDPGALQSLRVEGDPGRTAADPRRYARLTEEGPRIRYRLQSLWMEGFPAEGRRESAGAGLLKAREEVELRSESFRIERSSADRLDALFDGGVLQSLDLEGQVEIVRVPEPENPMDRERLTAGRLEIALAPSGQPETALAQRDVDIETNIDGTHRHLSAQRHVRLNYQEGLLKEAFAEGDCILESVGDGARRLLRSPRIQAGFQNGELERILAVDGVDLEVIDRDGSRRTQSRTLEVFYRAGELDRALQEGGFRLTERTPHRIVELRSENADFNAVSGVLEAYGGRPLLRTSEDSGADSIAGRSETTAERIRIHQVQEAIEAEGKVESIFPNEENPILVTAGKMRADGPSGTVEYWESPRMVQGLNLIRGDRIRFHRPGERLEAVGNVQSLLAESSDPGAPRYDVGGDELEYRKREGLAVYRGNVRVESDDLIMQAPAMELHFVSAESMELDRIEAYGGVQVTENGRRWTGDRATYFRSDQNVVVRAVE